MCHNISSINSYFICEKDMFIGYKHFKIKRQNSIKPGEFESDPFWEYPIEFINKRYCFYNKPTVQKIAFFLPEESGRSIYPPIYKEINAGMHIFSFNKTFKTGFWIENTHILIPVLFNKDDVIFWDGKDVSVERFYLPNIKEIINICKRDNITVSNKDFIDRYKKILAIADKQYKRQNKQKKIKTKNQGGTNGT